MHTSRAVWRMRVMFCVKLQISLTHNAALDTEPVDLLKSTHCVSSSVLQDDADDGEGSEARG